MKTFVTKEEYDISIQGICNGIDALFKRIEALENKSSENKKTQMTLMNGAGDTLELEGTEKQIEAFEAERKERNDALFPRALSFIKTVSLALEHGLTIKKVTTRK